MRTGTTAVASWTISIAGNGNDIESAFPEAEMSAGTLNKSNSTPAANNNPLVGDHERDTQFDWYG
jgi:hypothetical protein